RPENAPPRTPLHWALAFPEVFNRPLPGFDAIVGNPPFMGGQRISSAFGSDYRGYLLQYIGGGKRGSADLVSYFFLRAASVSRSIAFLAVNTIAQGDTREVGLEALEDDDWHIMRAVKSRPWPGRAGVHIAQIWLCRGASKQPPILEGQTVSHISPLLLPTGRAGSKPYRLMVNNGVAFQGSNILGLGFTMSADEAAALIREDPHNAEVLFPYLNAEDVCSNSNGVPTRWVINFFDWPLVRAEEYPRCLEIVRTRVKPQRDKNKDRNRRENWWRFTRPALELYRSIAGFEHVIVMPQISKVAVPIFQRTGSVFDQRLVVFASQSYVLFGLLTSAVHRAWTRLYGATFGTTPIYTPTDCFLTFPFIQNAEAIGALSEELSETRSIFMEREHLGLTSAYNLINDPKNENPDIEALRTLHNRLDGAVCRAYGWSDLDLEYGFHETEEGTRWTIGDAARSDILDRLLELNHERHREEQERGVAGTSAASANGERTRTRKAPSKRGAQIALTENNGN
ncbi:MAG: type IIL restriction-modification enzyme MmeI, partial [Candidatus Cybelea sp.]